MPRVTVVMPAHNAAKTIEAAITSVREQTFPDWELVVADDASSDGTGAIVEAIGDPRIRLVRTDENLGIGGARNLALDVAIGELVAFLDADDRFEPRYLEAMIARLDAEGPGVGIVCCDAWRVDAQGRRLERHAERFGTADGIGLTDLLRSNPIFVATLCPRGVVEEAGRFSRFPREASGAEDHDLWLRIVEAGHRVAYVNEPLVSYRVAEGQVSSNRSQMARADQATFRGVLARGRVDRAQARIARDRLALAVAAEAVARGVRAADAPALARAVVARARLQAARR